MKTCYINSKYKDILIPILDDLGFTLSHYGGSDRSLIILDIDSNLDWRCSTSSSPTIILSTSNVYSCLDSNNKVQEIPLSEDKPLTIPSTLSSYFQIQSINSENNRRIKFPNHTVLRLCNIYGESITNELISESLNHFRLNKNFNIFHSPYRKKSFLYVEDFKVILSKMISLTLEGLRGVYNIGGTDIITVGNLVETVYQILHQTNSKPSINTVDEPNRFRNFYEAVDISRIQALTNWKPEYSIRKGIWTYIQNELWKKQS